MSLYRFDGSRRSDRPISVLKIRDLNGIERVVNIGETVDLDPAYVASLTNIVLTPPDEPAPVGPALIRPVTAAGEPEVGYVPIGQGEGMPAQWGALASDGSGGTIVTGPAGPAGPVGPAGPLGPVGLTGAKGDKGDKGDKGTDGLQGPQGLQGPKGDPGAQGQQGTQGPVGPQGPDGTGAPGDQGPMGPEGPAGPAGADGAVGPQGPQGLQGDPGIIGPKGDQGVAGVDGAQGPAGAAGPQGAKGDPGNAGPAGAPGSAGVNWRGAWSVAIAYNAKDGVTWAGSSFVALANVAAGGATPATDQVNWLQIAKGGGEIAYAENVTNQIFGSIVAATQTDIPGCSIVVPANSGPVEIEGRIPMVALQVNAGAVVGELVQVYTNVTDESGNVVAEDAWQLPNPIATAGKNHWRSMNPKRRVPNNNADKTYKLGIYTPSLVSAHYTISVWAGPGNQTSQANGVANFDFTPAYVKARGA